MSSRMEGGGGEGGGGGGPGEEHELQFEGWSSSVDAAFWHELGRLKLERYKLSEAPVPLRARYATGGATPHPLPARLFLEAASFEEVAEEEEEDQPGGRRTRIARSFQFEAPGELLNTNTIEAFTALDKKRHLDQAAARIWDDIESGAALREPWLLCRFLMLAFSDLKKYRYHYMVGFPALLPSRRFVARQPVPLGDVFLPQEVQSLRENYESLRGVDEASRVAAAEHSNHPFFIAKRVFEEEGGKPSIQVAPLHTYEQFWRDTPHTHRYVGFADPSSLEKNPGWPLRNFLVLLSRSICRGMADVSIICYREVPGKRNIDSSLLLYATIPTDVDALIDRSNLKVAGWERDNEGKLRPRVVSLATSMDPKRLADTAVELNLQLMRWRLLPSLDLERIAATRCLLLGAGTLGCNVARNLLGWGVRHITLVDNGVVSYSNPVRQSLFTFEDSLNGGLPKAIAAAKRLKEIFPGVNATGHRFSIPMPGHAIAEKQQEHAQKDFEQLQQLIRTHDVVFLLTDSRESRWLPTLMAACDDKLVINAALGFDSYVVMRHGVWDRQADHPNEDVVNLGCYFCNDVVAPQDSLSDRTLDQQCTVTRPGVSYLAASLAVELLVSILHHPLGPRARADVDKDVSEPTESPLGLIPHQVTILDEAPHELAQLKEGVASFMARNGFEFLLRVCNEPTHLEDITGLTELKQSAVDFSLDWEQFEEDPDD